MLISLYLMVASGCFGYLLGNPARDALIEKWAASGTFPAWLRSHLATGVLIVVALSWPLLVFVLFKRELWK